MTVSPAIALQCPVCRRTVDPRRAFLDDGGAYHRRCAETGPTCALCSRSIAPGSGSRRAGDLAFHARCYGSLLADTQIGRAHV